MADGNSYVQYSGNTLANNGYFMFGYSPKSTIDLSNSTWLDLTLMSSMPGSLYVAVQDVHGAQMIFDGRSSMFDRIRREEINTWTNLTLPLQFPSFTTSTKPDLRSIQSIQIGLVDLPRNASETLRVGGLSLDIGARVPVPGIHFERRFGKLVFFEVDSRLDRIYPTTKISLVNNSSEAIAQLASRTSIPSQTTPIFEVSGSAMLGNLASGLTSMPQISFEQRDPSTWVVHVTASSTPFILVFDEAYDAGWKAFYANTDWLGPVFSQQIPQNFHYLANGFANAWYVDKTGSFSVTLFFWPQTLLSLGALISSLAISISLVVTFRKPIRTSASRVGRRIAIAWSHVLLIVKQRPRA
jgi:hypothetical protein